jgi:hypothetical protein
MKNKPHAGGLLGGIENVGLMAVNLCNNVFISASSTQPATGGDWHGKIQEIG